MWKHAKWNWFTTECSPHDTWVERESRANKWEIQGRRGREREREIGVSRRVTPLCLRKALKFHVWPEGGRSKESASDVRIQSLTVAEQWTNTVCQKPHRGVLQAWCNVLCIHHICCIFLDVCAKDKKKKRQKKSYINTQRLPSGTCFSLKPWAWCLLLLCTAAQCEDEQRLWRFFLLFFF